MDLKVSNTYEINRLKTDLAKFGGVFQDQVFFRIENPREKAEFILKQLIGQRYVHLPEYDAIYKWLTNNNGRGVLMSGNCGRGKSMFGRIVIPALLLRESNLCCNVVNSIDLGLKKEIINKKIISVDDVGREREYADYGTKMDLFPCLVDRAEQEGKLLIISTNLSLKELKERYGDRIVDRLKALTYVVEFKGESMRK